MTEYRCRPRTNAVLWLEQGAVSVHIMLYPQQRWKLEYVNDGTTARLEYRNTAIRIPVSDFDDYFILLNGDGGNKNDSLKD